MKNKTTDEEDLTIPSPYTIVFAREKWRLMNGRKTLRVLLAQSEKGRARESLIFLKTYGN